MDFIFLITGFVFLILGGNWLLKAAVALSLRLQIPKIVIGMTVVSFATSAPELIVSLNAALEGHADISLGNVIGSNIANLGLVLGIVTILSSINVKKSFYKTDWPVMVLASIIFCSTVSRMIASRAKRKRASDVSVGNSLELLFGLIRFTSTTYLSLHQCSQSLFQFENTLLYHNPIS